MTKDYISQARAVIKVEQSALEQISAQLDTGFNAAVEAILACQGRVIVTGMGKSGHIARKIAATLGIQYRLLADGEYNHTTVLVLLDADGRIVGRTKRIGASDPDFIKLVKQTLQAASRTGS